jgi:hypothetical protein
MNDRPLYLGLHIQKCAGTSLQVHLEECPRSNTWFWHTSPDINYRNSAAEVEARNLASRDAVRVIWGHEVFAHFMGFFPERPVYLFTFLRHPARRLISWYKYEARGYERAHGTLDGFEFFEQYLKKRQDHMCRFILNRFPQLDTSDSDELHQRAISILDKFAFVGLQENFQVGADRLMEFLGLPLFPENMKRNVDDGKMSLEYDLETIVANNTHDFALYEYALARYLDAPLPDKDRLVNPRDYGINYEADGFHDFIRLRARCITNVMNGSGERERFERDNLRKIVFSLIHQCFQERDPNRREFYQRMLRDMAREFNLNLPEEDIRDIPSISAIL